MATCGNCGAQLSEGTRYCPNCGRQAGTPAATPAPPPPSLQAGLPGTVPPPGVHTMAGPPARKGMSKGAKIALIVGISMVALIIIGIILAVVVFVGVLSKPADVANNYVSALNDGDLITAWDYLSSDAQREETRSGYNSKMEDFEGEIASYNTRKIEVSDGNARIVMDIKLESGEEGSWNMHLVKEDGEWKIRTVQER